MTICHSKWRFEAATDVDNITGPVTKMMFILYIGKTTKNKTSCGVGGLTNMPHRPDHHNLCQNHYLNVPCFLVYFLRAYFGMLAALKTKNVKGAPGGNQDVLASFTISGECFLQLMVPVPVYYTAFLMKCTSINIIHYG